MEKALIGFIGQGWIGKHYADDFQNRGYRVIRYALEEPHLKNGEKIQDCDIVFIAVPTPTTPQGFNDSIIREAIKKVGPGKIAVIKSTILPGTTESIQAENPDIYILHSPEFLTEATAAYDAANPLRNIIGAPILNDQYRMRAEAVMAVLPKAVYELICTSREAEIIKYGGNCWFYFKVVYINMLYDLASKIGARWNVVREAMAADPRIGSSHMNPVHASGEKGGEARPKLKFSELHLEPIHKSGRGAGGHCFIKDFAAFSQIYKKLVGDNIGAVVLESLEKKNISLLAQSRKDMELLAGVYGNMKIMQFLNESAAGEINLRSHNIFVFKNRGGFDHVLYAPSLKENIRLICSALNVKLNGGWITRNYAYLEISFTAVFSCAEIAMMIKNTIEKFYENNRELMPDLLADGRLWENECLSVPFFEENTVNAAKLADDFVNYLNNKLKNNSLK